MDSGDCLSPSVNRQTSTKHRIIAYGTALFLESGVTAITTNAIAAGAHVSKKTLYRCFTDKEELVSRVVLAWMEETLAPRDRVLCDENVFILERIASALCCAVDLRPYLHTQLLRRSEWRNISLELRARVEEMQRSQRAQLARLFKEAQVGGLLRDDLNPDHWVLLLVAAVQTALKPSAVSANGTMCCGLKRSLINICLGSLMTDKGCVIRERAIASC